MNELEALQNTLISLYQKNIAFLKSNHLNLYKRVKEFESLNKETLFINFENNHFELVDEKGNKTYNCNPFYDAQQRASNIESSQAVFSMIIDEVKSENFYEKDEISAHTCVQEFLDLKNHQETIQSEKFIFLGTLLGIHINDIHRILKQKAYLILEPSLETFRLSLFLTDYEELTQSAQLFFCIEENDTLFKKTLYTFLEYEFSYNHSIKFELASEKEFSLIEKLTNFITAYNPFIHSFSEELIDLTRGNNLLQTSLQGLLNYKELKLFSNTPILVLGAGPSLEKQAKFIQKFKNKFIIIAASAVLKRLEKIDVIPHIIFSIDQKEIIYDQFNVHDKYYKNSIILLSTKTHQKVFHKLKSYSTFLVQTSFEIFKDKGTLNAVSVGDFICKFCLHCQSQNVYLLGIDAAFDDTLQTHDELHVSNKRSVEKLLKVQGNFQESVITDTTYAEIISSFENLNLKEEQNVFNLSNTGAFLPNTSPLKTTNLKEADFINISAQEIADIYKAILDNTQQKYNQQTLITYSQEKQLLNELTEHENDFDTYVIKQYMAYPESLSLSIFYHYLKLINPYLFSNFNQKTRLIKQEQIKSIYNTLFNLFNQHN